MAKHPTLTEARTASRIVLVTPKCVTTCRNIPYEEVYRGATVLIESPADHLQRAAEDERGRNSKP